MKFRASMAVDRRYRANFDSSNHACRRKSNAEYDHVIECSSAVAVVAALIEGNAEVADVAAQMKAATPQWLDRGRAMKLKSDDAVMEDHKAAVTKRLEVVLADASASGDGVNALVTTAIGCVGELG